MLLIFFVTNKKTFLNVIIEEEDARAVAPGANQILPAKIINRGYHSRSGLWNAAAHPALQIFRVQIHAQRNRER